MRFGNRAYVSKFLRKFSMKIFDFSATISAIVSVTFRLVVLNLLLIIVCNPTFLTLFLLYRDCSVKRSQWVTFEYDKASTFQSSVCSRDPGLAIFQKLGYL